MKRIIAIDPGASGGIAVSKDGGIFTMSMPDTIAELVIGIRSACEFNEYHAWVAYVEHVQGYVKSEPRADGSFGQPGSAMFRFGENFGAVQGIIQALGIPLILVRPQKWQKPLGVGTRSLAFSRSEWKRKLKAEAQRRFPGIAVTLKTADALLILDYGIKDQQAHVPDSTGLLPAIGGPEETATCQGHSDEPGAGCSEVTVGFFP